MAAGEVCYVANLNVCFCSACTVDMLVLYALQCEAYSLSLQGSVRQGGYGDGSIAVYSEDRFGTVFGLQTEQKNA